MYSKNITPLVAKTLVFFLCYPTQEIESEFTLIKTKLICIVYPSIPSMLSDTYNSSSHVSRAK